MRPFFLPLCWEKVGCCKHVSVNLCVHTGVCVHVYRHVLQVCVYIQGCVSTGRCVCVYMGCMYTSRYVLACVWMGMEVRNQPQLAFLRSLYLVFLR